MQVSKDFHKLRFKRLGELICSDLDGNGEIIIASLLCKHEVDKSRYPQCNTESIRYDYLSICLQELLLKLKDIADFQVYLFCSNDVVISIVKNYFSNIIIRESNDEEIFFIEA